MSPTGHRTADPKIARDPYLRLVADRWGDDAVLDAGWFDDGDPTDAPLDDVGWLCTPIDVVQRAVGRLTRPGPAPRPEADPGQGRIGTPPPNPVVLLSTGGFFPVHGGHVAMMEAARRGIDDGRRRVVGGYLSPAHDDYIRLKCGAVDVPVSDRLAHADAAIAPSGWLSIDPWEALARRVAVNYTDVTARLETYLRHHVDPRIDVVYVCGGDNARFSLAFTERGSCVVVGRPGSEETVDRWRADHRVAGNPRITWTDGDDATSSTTVRRRSRPEAASRTARPDPVAVIGTEAPSGCAAEVEVRPGVTLRLEDERAVATLGIGHAAWRRFQDGLRSELAALVELGAVTLEDQRSRATVAGTISLDPMLPGEIDIGISRQFDLGGYRPLRHISRPGSPSLHDGLASIPPGTWTLRDDDRSTGGTVRFVIAQLPDGVELAATTFAVAPDADGEIADSRDFLLGADDGGLVVALPGAVSGRAPYLLPYVDPAARSGIPAGSSLAFSAALWDRNAAVFAGTRLTVADLPAPAARTMACAGHPPDAHLVDVCRHHAATLRSLLPPEAR